MKAKRFKLIVLDGPDGSGKHQMAELLYQRLAIDKQLPAKLVHFPGGTELGCELRRILKDPSFPYMSDRVERLLFAADYLSTLEQVFEQAEGIIIAHRYLFTDYAYANRIHDFVSQVHTLLPFYKADLSIFFQGDPPALWNKLNLARSTGAHTPDMDPVAECRIEGKGHASYMRLCEAYNSITTKRPPAGERTTAMNAACHILSRRVHLVDALGNWNDEVKEVIVGNKVSKPGLRTTVFNAVDALLDPPYRKRGKKSKKKKKERRVR